MLSAFYLPFPSFSALAKRFGAIKILKKPFDKQVLLNAVEVVLAAPIEVVGE
jgi:hypothetical protein